MDEVIYIQNLLNAHRYSVIVDGEYGEKTAEAVAAFQKECGIYVTGLIDCETLDALEIKPQ